MKSNTLKRLLMVLGLAGLMAGCASNKTSSQGGVGSGVQQEGPNGSQSAANPFGIGTGTGLTAP